MVWQQPGGLGHVLGITGRDSPCLAAALLLAGPLGLGLWGSAQPSLSRGDPRISGFGWKMLLPCSRHQPGAAGELPVVRRGDWESPQPLLPGLVPASAQGWFSGAQAFQEFVRN